MIKKVFIAILILLPIIESKFFHRFQKVECGSSLKSASKLYCFLKAYTRTSSVMNFGFTLNRKISKGMVC